VVVAIDTRYTDGEHVVHTHGGRTPTHLRTLAWAREVEQRGAGEILLTSMDHDGTKNGFAKELTGQVSRLVSIPVIASGGAGNQAHFADLFRTNQADAALAASIFHFKTVDIGELKHYLRAEGVCVRI
jgi:imidazole glycerol-phosphate synthase subunit HisF